MTNSTVGETYRCPGCAGEACDSAPSYNAFEMVQCRGCRLLHTRIRDFPTSQYEAVYANQGAYRSMLENARRTADGELGFKDLWWFKKLALRWLEKLTKGRLLDVGTGPGTFLFVAKSRGWDVTGVEPTPEPVEFARGKGLNVELGTVDQLVPRMASTFDAATSFEVLEHVARPAEMVRAIATLLRPGGFLVLSVPNLDDPYCLRQMIPSAVPPVHINFFNRSSLRRVLEAGGLRVVRFKTLPIPTSSVRNSCGDNGFFVRLPGLFLRSLFGRADGTTLVVLAEKPA